ncbi:3-oxo-5-alpha-steroid 4-dehydrogenase [Tothia fuscella]|uniref:3-oxo-5-alpha-steroid 4-dehydrogenase n=1 Tax=Tothia fuscella TaxID=1048955 RepID=A0A9P4NFA4_9PEZI|nr:3-oxo-5-alpha-steroid 4-dehydrogenase [Tothia fuscella]
MALIEGYIPPTREHWETIAWLWQFFPLLTAIQWLTDFYPMGKTSIESRLNIPGKIGWFTMEAPGFMILLYIMYTLPQELNLQSLPPTNWVMAGMFTIHYIYRAILAPLFLNPSMAPMHPIVWISALAFQVFNAISIGGWLGGHGPITLEDWAGRLYTIQFGMIIWAVGLMGNIFHDDELREIRRAANRRQKKEAEKEGKSVDEYQAQSGKIYMLPKNGLFHFILFPHYFCEWIEWAGFWVVGGWDCLPARAFLGNEIASMLPRALQGREWYVKRFGRDKVGNRKAIIPGLL